LAIQGKNLVADARPATGLAEPVPWSARR